MTLFNKATRLPEILLSAATVVMLLVPCYGQQEVDPSWYDPWASPSPVVARVLAPRTSHPKPPVPASLRTDVQRSKTAKKPAPVTTAKVRAITTTSLLR